MAKAGFVQKWCHEILLNEFDLRGIIVTGSAHCILTPYWAGKLGRNILNARQISRCGGEITCELKGDRVSLSGKAVTFMQAEIWIQ